MKTDTVPTSTAIPVLPYACWKAQPAPKVSTEPGTRHTVQTMYTRERIIGPETRWSYTQVRKSWIAELTALL